MQSYLFTLIEELLLISLLAIFATQRNRMLFYGSTSLSLHSYGDSLDSRSPIYVLYGLDANRKGGLALGKDLD